MAWAPSISVGTTATPAFAARLPMPGRNGPWAPFRVRVPSGNTTTTSPARSLARMVFIPFTSPRSRLIGIVWQKTRKVPNTGFRKSVDLPMK